MSTKPFNKILLKVRVNEKKAAKLAAALQIQISTVDATTRNAQVQAHANIRGEAHYLRTGGRKNAAGEKLGDTGRPVFGFEGARFEAISLLVLAEDLASAGYMVSNVALKAKRNDRMVALEITFLPGDENSFVFTDEGATLVNAELSRPFGHCHVWDNRSSFGSATVNMAHAVSDEDMAKLSDPRFLRFSIDEAGSPHWTNERGTSPKQATSPVVEATA